jgi:hypothetical protein
VTDAERAFVKKLAFTVSTLCQVVAARDPFGTLSRLSQELDVMSSALDAATKENLPPENKTRGRSVSDRT